VTRYELASLGATPYLIAELHELAEEGSGHRGSKHGPQRLPENHAVSDAGYRKSVLA